MKQRAQWSTMVWLVAGVSAPCAVVINGCGEPLSSDCASSHTCVDSDAAGTDGTTDGPIGDGAVVDGESDAATDGRGDGPSDALTDNWDGFDGFTCNPTWTPSDNNCVVDDSFGVFVSGANGVDGAAGTKAAPLKKIQDGIAKAKLAGKRLYVCAGTYAENAVIDASKDGVRIYGGLSCSTWTYATTNKVIVAPASGYALKLDTLTTGARIEDVEFDGPNGVNPGDSSIAVFANTSPNVTLKRVVIKAGNGVAGTAGTSTSNYDAVTQDDAKIAGHDAVGATGGGPQLCDTLCKNNVHSTGGSGGTGGAAPTGGGSGAPSLGAGDGGTVVQCATSVGGQAGTAAPAAAGGTGASAPGTLTAMAWSPSDSATDGVAGGPGQGGGGGGGGTFAGNRGGGAGGGCGGCGGGNGTRGRPGGSSFALVSFNSAIVLDSCTLSAAAAKDGGKGGDGQAGQLGGLAGNSSSPGCNGGLGGTGGAGGGGGGGAGGISAAIFYKGTQPTAVNGTTATKGAGASGGAAGASGSPAATPGATTVSQDIMMAP